MSIIIAIDGYSSTGKSTLAKDMAKSLNYMYVDSGAMYRAVTLYALQNGWIGKGEVQKEEIVQGLSGLDLKFVHGPEGQRLHLNGRDVEDKIRTMHVAKWVSPIATISEVRSFLVELQQAFGKAKGIVMDGRDIGTVVFPQAELKIFVTADPIVRAKRRLAEMESKGGTYSLEEVRDNLSKRDEMDSNRSDSPLRQAEDARLLDNSSLNREEQLALALSWVQDVVN